MKPLGVSLGIVLWDSGSERWLRDTWPTVRSVRALITESSMEQFRFDGDSGSLGVSVGGRSSWEWGTGEAAHW